MKLLTIGEALRQALREEMKRDQTVFLMGEDIGVFGGPFQVTRGLLEEFGPERVRDTPISELGFVGAAVGAAMTGMRPVVEVQYADFLTICMDQVVNQAAKMRLMSGGEIKVPMVLRAPLGATTRGAQHSQSPEAWFMHIPGLKVVIPSTPYDAKGLLKSAIRDDNPVIFFEHKYLYGTKSPGGKAKTAVDEVAETFTPATLDEYTIPFGKAEVRRKGGDITVIATLLMVHKTLKVAELLQKDDISIEVIDPKTLVPFDKETILESVIKTGRVVIVTEDSKTGGVGAEIAAIISEEAFDYLNAPIKRVAALDTPIPFAPLAERYVIPDEDRIINAIKEIIDE